MSSDTPHPLIESAVSRPAFALRVHGLSKRYHARRSIFRNHSFMAAVTDVNFKIAAGKTLALVGASGSGKSTVARCVACLEKADAGEIWMATRDVARLSRRELFRLRPEMQMIFQDPATAMNPRLSAAAVIEEPLIIQRRGSREERRAMVAELMKEVGLTAEWMDRRVTDFSGGQKQRIAIARALVLQPRLLILDEAFTGLDLSIQAQIANLLLELQAAHSLTYLLISHDLTLVSRMADAVAVLSAGQVVEQGTPAEILGNPKHPETRALVAAASRSKAAFAAAGASS